ncbi:DUF5693 family protein [Anaerovorax odorimutans]|uniref:DUF5693 family protein n=1 Tax=Anaerovorax odorimutans TaxID=109327 RepID=UPI000426D170|nr:DUF5693 family protein [Anaerovorax odorimutans]
MKTFIKENKILLLIIVVAIIAAVSVLIGRFNVESKNKVYDIVLDYSEIEEMANQSEHDVAWWFNQFKDMGITKVGLSEENLITLTENKDVKVSAEIMYKIMQEADWEKNYPSNLIEKMKDHGYDKDDVLIEAASKQDYDFLLNAITSRFSSEKYYYEANENGGYIVLDGTPKETLYKQKYKLVNSKKKESAEINEIYSSRLFYLNFGMLQSKVDILNKTGMEIIPRTASYKGWNDTKYANAVINDYNKLNLKYPYMIVGGEAVIGNDDGNDIARKYIEDNNIKIGLIENTTQRQNILQYGVEDIVRYNNNYNAVRIFTVWDYIQNRYKYYGYEGAEEIENTLFRAIVERNIRVIYFKPIKEYKDQQVYVTDVNEYKTMFSNLEKRLKQHNIHFGQASVMHNYHVNLLAELIMALGCIAAFILLIQRILPVGRKVKLVLFLLGILFVIGIVLFMPSYLKLLCSFAAAVIFPCLAVSFISKQSKLFEDTLNKDEKITKIIPLAISVLIIGVIISLLGSIMTAAPISSINYMLEIDIFRGVKLAQLLPIAFFIIVYLAYFGFKGEKKSLCKLEFNDIKDILNTNIKIWMILLGVIIIGVGWYYIDRTGHESSVEVSNLEMIFRNALEDHLLARPRNKEFLFAFPAVMMFVYTSVRGFKLWPFIFGLSSVIGMTCVVNTFMHIRTPLYLGFVRTGYSLSFGIIAGVLAIIVFELIYKLYKKIERLIV